MCLFQIETIPLVGIMWSESLIINLHDASVHRILKLLASITPGTEPSSIACFSRKGIPGFNPSGLCSILQAKAWPFILSVCALILLGSLDSTTAPHQAFHYHLMNQSVYLCGSYLIVSSLCTCRPFQYVKLVRASRIIQLGR